MNNDRILKQFEEIEEKVERVIKVCRSYETTNLELTKKNQKLEEELQSKVEAERRYQEEKTLIRSRIDNLIARIGNLTDI